MNGMCVIIDIKTLILLGFCLFVARIMITRIAKEVERLADIFRRENVQRFEVVDIFSFNSATVIHDTHN